MEKSNLLAVMGSPGSGKTTTTIKLAQALARQHKNVIVVFCDPFTPTISAILPADTLHDTSLGSLLTAPTLSQTDILNAGVSVKESEYISLLGYRSGESLMNFPKITRDKAVEFFVMLRYLADYVIIDCATVFEADITSLVGIEVADRVLKLGTANLKGISYFQTHNPMLLDSRYRKETHQTALANLKVGQDFEAVSGQYGGVDYILPYAVELEKQDNELSLFQPMVEPESSGYENAIVKLLAGLFSLQTTKAIKGKSGSVPSVAPTTAEKKTKGRLVFKLPFGKNKGEF